jgi:hypothetical protein
VTRPDFVATCVRLFVFSWVSCFGSACRRNPQLEYAHLLERCASWSASVQFTNEMARAQNVTHGYVHDVLFTGARDVERTSRTISEDEDVPADARTDGAALCARVAGILQDADRGFTLARDGELKDVEQRLRTLAQAARDRAGQTHQ